MHDLVGMPLADLRYRSLHRRLPLAGLIRCGHAWPVMDDVMRAPIAYRRLDPTSPICVYQSGDGFIWIGFAHRGRRTAYRYTDASAGATAVARMQELAARGRGLATYITRHLTHGGYDRRIAF